MYIYVNLNLPSLPSPLLTWCPYIRSLHPCLYFSICRQVQLYYFSKFHIYIYINVRHLFSSFWHFTLTSLGPPWKVLTIIFFSVLFHKIYFECLLCTRHGSHLSINWSSPVAPSLQWEIDLKTNKKKKQKNTIHNPFRRIFKVLSWLRSEGASAPMFSVLVLNLTS